MKFLIAILAMVGGVVFINNFFPSLWENSILLVDYKVPVAVIVVLVIGYLGISK